jgi:hypothetical protein
MIYPPPPGRDFDNWVAEHVLDRDPLNARHGLHENGDLEYYWGYPIGHDVAPSYSTSYEASSDVHREGWLWWWREEYWGLYGHLYVVDLEEQSEEALQRRRVNRVRPEGGRHFFAHVRWEDYVAPEKTYKDLRREAYAHCACLLAFQAEGGVQDEA